MYVEINKDILQDALDKKGFDKNTSRDTLLLMALCAMFAKHYVVVPSLSNNQKLRTQLEELIGKDYVAALAYNTDSRNRQNTAMLKGKVYVRAVLTISGQTSVENGVITINLLDKKNFEPWDETFILTENLIDSEFYAYLVSYYLSKEGMSKCKKFYHALMGGGVTISDVLRQEINKEKRFCLAIADSDKDYPDDNKHHDTSSNLLKLLKSSPFNCSAYVMDKVREIENLIPMRLVKAYGDHAGCQEILSADKDPSYFDMKNGLLLKNLYDKQVYQYWKDMFPDDKERFEERDKQRKDCKSGTEYREKVKEAEPIKRGFGGKLLANVLEAERNSSKRKEKLTLHQITDSDLNSYQQDEWYEIGKHMFSWTCAARAS